MRRRAFITLLGAAAAARPLAARAQQPAIPVIGFLNPASPDLIADRVRAFHQGLGETGHIDGRDVEVDHRWADGQDDRMPTLAAELVRRRVSVIAATSGPSAQAAKAATATIPIVFNVGVDPVETGLVASLNRPGGNLTGVTSLGVEVGPKRLELLHELVPQANVIALLMNPIRPNTAAESKEMQAAAAALGLQLHILHASSERDFGAAFANLLQVGAGALMIGPDSFLNSRNDALAALTLRHRVPTIFQYRDFPAAGGLMSYGGSLTENYRMVGVYAGRILNGEKPGDLPVQQATKVELIINLKTAKALGLTVPLSLLGRADEVIE
jgi:putative ABC transport system substrate-binding protein